MYLVKINKFPEEVIIRFSNNTKKDSNLSKEKYIIETLRKNKIPAPKILGFSEDYMIIEKIQGEKLDNIWNNLTKQEKISITEKIGKLAKDIHKIKLSKFGKIEERGNIKSDEAFKFRKTGKKSRYSSWLREFLKMYTDDLARLASYPLISRKFLAKAMNYTLINSDTINYKGKPTLIHGDLFPGHIFVRKINGKYKIIGIIDFEFAQSHAPEYDFIKLHRNRFFDIPELKQALEKGYGKINIEAVEIYRITRDLGFAWAVLESGNKKLSNKTIKDIEKRLDKKIT